MGGAYLKLIHASTEGGNFGDACCREEVPIGAKAALVRTDTVAFPSNRVPHGRIVSRRSAEFRILPRRVVSCFLLWGRVLEKPTGSKRVLARMADVQCQTACISHGRFF